MIRTRRGSRRHAPGAASVIDRLESRRLLIFNIEFNQYLMNQENLGGVGELPIVGDFNGDQRDDIGIYIPNGSVDARWVVKFNQGNGSFNTAPTYNVDRHDLGGAGEIPIVGDFNGDKLDDIGIYIPNGSINARWVVKFNKGNGSFVAGGAYNIDRVDLGGVGETPLVGDFNNDGLDDIGIYIPNGTVNARWVIKFNKGNGGFAEGARYDIDLTSLGGVGETPFIGDFDFNGADDLGVYIPNGNIDATWAVAFNRGAGTFPAASDVRRKAIGGSGEQPVVGQFDSNVRSDLGVYIPNGNINARWAIKHIDAVQSFHSDPSSPIRLELDFDGTTIDRWGGHSVGAIPAYDSNNDPMHFSEDERTALSRIWAAVSEKFSPFNVDVTTDISGNLRDGKEFKIVIGGDGAWYDEPGAAGVAYLDGFRHGASNIGFVFSEGFYTTSAVAEAVAHEAGHGFGLKHQRRANTGNDADEYNDNNGSSEFAPIMGSSYNAAHGRWWSGYADVPFGLQFDILILDDTDHGPGRRGDEYGNSLATATQTGALSAGWSKAGVIGLDDFGSAGDHLSFDLTSPRLVTFGVQAAAFGAMLDPDVALLNSSGTPIASGTTLSAGRYTVRVTGPNQGANTGYNIGQYTVTVQSFAPPQIASAGRNRDTGEVFATFTNDVGPFITREQFSLRDLRSGLDVDLSSMSYRYNPSTKTATFGTYTLPAGPYQLRFKGGLTDVQGGYIPQDADGTSLITGFSFRNGDANGDNRVDFDDLVILAQNYGLSGRTFSQGNLNYSPDGKVDFDDLVVLAQNYGSALNIDQALLVATPAMTRRPKQRDAGKLFES